MKPEDDFEQRVRKALDDSVAGLDGETRSRLSAIRHKALAQRRSRMAWWQGFNAWVPATAIAVAAVFAVTMLIDNAPPGSNGQLALEDGEIVLELVLGEDLPSEPDFYVWLEEILLEQEASDHAT